MQKSAAKLVFVFYFFHQLLMHKISGDKNPFVQLSELVLPVFQSELSATPVPVQMEYFIITICGNLTRHIIHGHRKQHCLVQKEFLQPDLQSMDSDMLDWDGHLRIVSFLISLNMISVKFLDTGCKFSDRDLYKQCFCPSQLRLCWTWF